MKRYYASFFVLFVYLSALLARLVTKWSDWFTPLEMFLPVALWVVNAPTVDVLETELGISFILLLILLATVIGEFESEMTTWQYGYAFFFGAIGLLLSFVVGHQLGFLYYLTSLVGLTVGSVAALLLVGVNPARCISMSVRYAGLTALITLTAGLLREMRWVLDVVLAGIGVYVLYVRYWRRIEQNNLLLGLDEILFRTIIRVGKSPKGIVTSSLIYAGMFLNLMTLTVLFPFFVTLGFTQDVFASPSGVILYFSALFQMFFFGAILMHWTSLLTRVPNSVTYWEGGSKYDYDLEKRAANRPLIRGLIPLVFGVALTEAVQGMAQTNPLVLVSWGPTSAAVYLVLVSTVFVYSIAAVPEFGLIRKWVPGSRFLVSDRPQLERDSWTYFVAGILLTVVYAIVNDLSTFVIMIGLLALYVTELFLAKNAQITLLVGASFVFLLPLLALVSETGSHLWQILVIFWFTYLLLVVHSTREAIVESFAGIGILSRE